MSSWTNYDEQMLSSITTELYTLQDTYAFARNCPSDEKEKEEMDKAIAFKYTQIEWLEGLKERMKED